VSAGIAPAERWAAGATALLVAREVFVAGGRLADPVAAAAELVLGGRWTRATSIADFADRLPSTARWALAGVDEPIGLWRAEARWWSRVRRDGSALLGNSRFGPERALGAVALLAVDAWQVGAALELAARGGGPLEVFDAVA
jgi:hypothetical protein